MQQACMQSVHNKNNYAAHIRTLKKSLNHGERLF